MNRTPEDGPDESEDMDQSLSEDTADEGSEELDHGRLEGADTEFDADLDVDGMDADSGSEP